MRGTFVVTRACVPHLRAAENPHILTLSPPISLEPRWLGPHVGYTLAKYGMTLCALGFAAEFAEDGIASNALWPRTLVATAAVQNLLGGDEAMQKARKPEVYADAAYAILVRAEPRVHRQRLPVRGRARRRRASPTSPSTATCPGPTSRSTSTWTRSTRRRSCRTRGRAGRAAPSHRPRRPSCRSAAASRLRVSWITAVRSGSGGNGTGLRRT